MTEQEHAGPARTPSGSTPPSPGGPGRSPSGVHWEVRRNRKPWQHFFEKFGFTLIAIGVAMMVGVLIAKMG